MFPRAPSGRNPAVRHKTAPSPGSNFPGREKPARVRRKAAKSRPARQRPCGKEADRRRGRQRRGGLRTTHDTDAVPGRCGTRRRLAESERQHWRPGRGGSGFRHGRDSGRPDRRGASSSFARTAWRLSGVRRGATAASSERAQGSGQRAGEAGRRRTQRQIAQAGQHG